MNNTPLRDSLRQFLRTRFLVYPHGLTEGTPIEGIAFFPGGPGVYWERGGGAPPDIPHKGVMVLGNDFGRPLSTYRANITMQGESTGPTWRQLLQLLQRGDIRPEECFFTNAYMGLRTGEKQEGPSPGVLAGDEAFISACREFFLDQLRIQQPWLVLALGKYVPPFLAKLSPSLKLWEGGIEGIDFSRLSDTSAVMYAVNFRDVIEVRPTVVALLHPSKRHLNLHTRKYDGLQGDEAEVRMLHDARARHLT